MIAAERAVQRPHGARLLVVDADGRITDAKRSRWLDFLQRGDLLIANDAATLPASLFGTHVRTGQPIEVRLAAWRGAFGALSRTAEFYALVFGTGDYRTRTEDRPPPPALVPGDTLLLGALLATVERVLGHPRLVHLRFEASLAQFWRAIAAFGKPIQYAHLRNPMGLRDAWAPIAASPVAFEPPSAGFVVDWQALATMRVRGIDFTTLTHAAGLSSTGDKALDRRLPFDEPYRIPPSTAQSIARAQHRCARIIAVGTTVVRALEHAVRKDGVVHGGSAIATQRVGAHTRLRIVDGIVTGTHEPGSSHYELLRAFAGGDVLQRASDALERQHFRTHEFGDSMLLFTAREIRLRGVFPAFPGLRDARRTRAPATMRSPRPQPHTSSRVRMAPAAARRAPPPVCRGSR